MNGYPVACTIMMLQKDKHWKGHRKNKYWEGKRKDKHWDGYIKQIGREFYEETSHTFKFELSFIFK